MKAPSIIELAKFKRLVTPDLAREWLGENKINRSPKRGKHHLWARDMLEGRWNSDNPGSAIVFGKETGLLDGQNRLYAIVVAEQIDPTFPGVEMYVYGDVPDRARDFMDIGTSRSVADVLNMKGHTTAAPTVAAAAQLVMNYLDGERLNHQRSRPDKVTFILANPELIQLGIEARPAYSYRQAALAAVTFLGTRARGVGDQTGYLHEHALHFLHGVANGAALSLGDPRLTLRDTFNKERGRATSNKASFAMAAIAYAWNAFVTGIEMNKINMGVTDDGEYVVPPIHGAPERGAGIDHVEAGKLLPKARELAVETARAWEVAA